MAIFTVFHEHPVYGKGRYITECVTAREAVNEAKEKIADEHASNPDDMKELAQIQKGLSIQVFSGRHTTTPKSRPEASFQLRG